MFPSDPDALHRYLRARDAIRGHDWSPNLDLSHLGLREANLSGAYLRRARMPEHWRNVTLGPPRYPPDTAEPDAKG